MSRQTKLKFPADEMCMTVQHKLSVNLTNLAHGMGTVEVIDEHLGAQILIII